MGVHLNCEALRCQEAGFELHNSQFNSFDKCKTTLITNDDPDKGVVGFSTSAGLGNLFYECVADGIISTTSTFKKNAIGFLFTGSGTNTETESKIINSIVNTVQVSGCGTGYGIFLEPIFLDNLFTPTFTFIKAEVDFFDTAHSVAWSPDGKFLAYGGQIDKGSGDRDIIVEVFRFNGSELIFTTSYTNGEGGGVDTARSVAWSPDGKFLAYGGQIDKGSGDKNIIVEVFRFNGSKLIFTTSYTNGEGGGEDVANSVSWSPDGKYLAYGGQKDTGIIVEVLRFNESELILIDTYPDAIIPTSRATSVAWSPDSKFLAYGGQISSGGFFDIIVQVLSFNGSELILIDSYTKDEGLGDIANSVAWSPDGKYLAYGGQIGISDSDTIVDVFDEIMSSPFKCKIENNNIDNCTNPTVAAGGAIGISAPGGINLIVKNISYENDISVIYGVFNTFFGGLNGTPNLFDNLSVPPYNVEFN